MHHKASSAQNVRPLISEIKARATWCSVHTRGLLLCTVPTFKVAREERSHNDCVKPKADVEIHFFCLFLFSFCVDFGVKSEEEKFFLRRGAFFGRRVIRAEKLFVESKSHGKLEKNSLLEVNSTH
jgi:hypothetical protein